jgi:hypothetical protein
MQRLYSGMIRFCLVCQRNREHYPLYGDGIIAWACAHLQGEECQSYTESLTGANCTNPPSVRRRCSGIAYALNVVT